MKKSISILAIIFTLIISCKEEVKVAEDSFLVEGTITGLDSDYLTRSYKDINGNRKTDSIKVENEQFSYTAKIDEPTFIVFWPNVKRTIKTAKSGGYYPVKSGQFAFIAAPGAHLVFEGEVSDFINAYPNGDATNKELAEINKRIFPLMNKSVNLLLEQGNYEQQDSTYMALADSIKFYDDQVNMLKKDFVNTNINSKAAAWYLSDMMLRSQIADEEAINCFKAFDRSMENDPYYKVVAQRVAGIEASKIGQQIPNFIKQDVMTKTTFDLTSTRGKYVLIDFWGTWCGPCVAEMPEVKAYGEKYKDQLVVIGINQGDTEEKLMAFVNKNDYDWTQLMVEEDDLVLKLNVAGFPTKFIVDPEGKILYRFVGDSSESFAKLDELLSKTPNIYAQPRIN